MIDEARLIYFLDNREKKFLVQTFSKNLLFYLMRSQNSAIRFKSDKLQIPVLTQAPNNGAWIVPGDDLPTGGGFTPLMGEINHRYCAVPVTIDRFIQSLREGDPTVVFNQYQLNEMNAVWAMRRKLAEGLWTGQGGKAPDSVSYMIEKRARGSQLRTVSGFDKASNIWANNQYVQMTTDAGYIAPGTTIPAIFLALDALLEATSIGACASSHVVTTKAVFSIFKRAMKELSQQVHMMSDKSSAEYGFDGFLYDGFPIHWDQMCPSDSLYALPLKDNMRSALYLGKGTTDKARKDPDLEDIGYEKFADFDSSMGLIQHPAMNMTDLRTGSNTRNMVETSWKCTSENLFFRNMGACGVMGSDNGKRLSTW